MNKVSLNSAAIARFLGVIAAVLLLAHIGGLFSSFVLGHNNLKGLVLLFDFDEEKNIPTYFSALLMLVSTLLLAIITLLNGKQREAHVSKWAILSLGFLFMAYDEIFELHEKLDDPIRTLLGGNTLGVFYYAWLIPGIALVLVLALFFLKFLLHLAAKTRLRFMMAATLYLSGAIGCELIGGRHAEVYGYQNLTYCMITTVEESLEIAALILFIWALLKYCDERYKDVLLEFKA